MRFSAPISALAFAALALAQDQTIKVGEVAGKMTLAFDPPSVNATKGSVITFVFDGVPGNHTVTQSTFAKPCEPVQNGFSSGFVFDKQGGPFATWNLTVDDDTKPIWFYCAQTNPAAHCLAGMVGAINAPATGNTFDTYKANAQSAQSVIQASTILSGVGAFATASPATVTNTAPSASGTGASNSTGTSSGGAPQSTKPSSAGTTGVNGLVAVVAAAFGVVLL